MEALKKRLLKVRVEVSFINLWLWQAHLQKRTWSNCTLELGQSISKCKWK